MVIILRNSTEPHDTRAHRLRTSLESSYAKHVVTIFREQEMKKDGDKVE